MYKKKSVLIATFNRKEEISKTIIALQNCLGINEYQIVITYHAEITDVSNYLNSLKIDNLILIPVNGIGRSKIQNININRIFGLKYLFEILQSEIAVCIEDDIELGYDALRFSEFIISKYSKDPQFRCINLGSRERFTSEKKFCYGLFRYGIFGQGSCISRAQYTREVSEGLHQWEIDMGLDSMLEDYYKTGFVVMPYASRYIDNGWNGTHAPKDSSDTYYEELRSSFVGTEPFEIKNYERHSLHYRWRADCIPYKKINNIFFSMKYKKFKYFSKKI